MLNLGCNYVLSLISIEFSKALQYHVVWLGRSRGKDYLFRVSAY
jgi:hypothetical protein